MESLWGDRAGDDRRGAAAWRLPTPGVVTHRARAHHRPGHAGPRVDTRPESGPNRIANPCPHRNVNRNSCSNESDGCSDNSTT